MILGLHQPKEDQLQLSSRYLGHNEDRRVVPQTDCDSLSQHRGFKKVQLWFTLAIFKLWGNRFWLTVPGCQTECTSGTVFKLGQVTYRSEHWSSFPHLSDVGMDGTGHTVPTVWCVVHLGRLNRHTSRVTYTHQGSSSVHNMTKPVSRAVYIYTHSHPHLCDDLQVFEVGPLGG